MNVVLLLIELSEVDSSNPGGSWNRSLRASEVKIVSLMNFMLMLIELSVNNV